MTLMPGFTVRVCHLFGAGDSHPRHRSTGFWPNQRRPTFRTPRAQLPDTKGEAT
jgi:hypothetical protein